MKLLKSFSTYTIIGFLGSGISLLIAPILTHYLTKADYGVLTLFNTYVTILIPIIGLTSTSILSVDYFKISGTPYQNLFKSSLIPPAIGLVVLSVLFLLLRQPLSVLTEVPEDWLLLIPIIAFMVMVFELLQSQLVIRKEAKMYGAFMLSKIIVEVSLTLLFVTVLLYGWKGRISSWLIAMTLALIPAYFFFRKWQYNRGNINKADIIRSLAFGIPLISHQLGKFVINQSDRLFIAKMTSLDDTGVYSIGYVVGATVLIFANAGHKVFNPFFFERMNDLTREKAIEIVRFSWGFFLAIGLFTAIVSFLSPFVFDWVIDSEFAEGASYVFWIGLSYWFWGGYLILSNYIFHLKRTKILGYIALVNVSLNLLLNYFLIDLFGPIGAAYATAISFITVFVIVAIVAQRLFPMPWFNFRVILKR